MSQNIYKYLFFLERDFHIALLKPLIFYINKHKLGEIKVYAPFNNNIQITLRSYLPFFVETTVDPWSWQPDITFMADFSYQYVEGLGKIVNIGHGTISKGWFFSKNKISQRENCADLICVPGTVHKDRLKAQVYKPIEVTGMPKLDNCFNNSLNREGLLTKMGLALDQKTILLAPTFNEEFSIMPYLETANLSQIFPEYINLIVKLHGVSDERQKNIFLNLKNYDRKVYIADGYDIDELFFVADLLISDVSSVIYEFLSLDRPVLIFDSPKQKSYINLDETDLEWEYRDVGYRFDNIDKLPGLIFKVLTSYKPVETQYNASKSVETQYNASKSVETQYNASKSVETQYNASKPVDAMYSVSTGVVDSIAKKFISVTDGTSTERVIKAAHNLLTGNKTPELTIVMDRSNPNLSARFCNQFPIVTLQNASFFSSITSEISAIHSEYILYMDSSCDYSPQVVNLLLNQIKNNPQAGIVVPLVSDNEVHLQQVKFRVSLEQNLNLTQMGIQLSYAFTGQNKEIDFILPNCFVVRKKLILNRYLTDVKNEKLCLLELLTHITQEGYKTLLAYDCMMLRSEQPAQQPKEEKYQYAEALQKEVESVSELSEEELKQKLYDNPHNESIIIKLINYYYNNQKWEQLDIYADMLPHNKRAVYFGIKSLENQNFVEEAFRRIELINFNELPELDLLVNFLVLKAKLLIKLQRSDQVIVLLEKAIQLDPANSEALFTRAVFYFSQNMTQEAIRDFDILLATNPQNVKALSGKAMALQQENNLLEASRYYIKVLDFDAENMDAIGGLLKISWITRDFSAIEKALDDYLDFHPANLDILFTLAGICYESQKYDKALELLDRILVLDGEFAGAKELYTKVKAAIKK